MKDYWNQDLAVGDTVSFCRPKYRDFTDGKIIKITPKLVILEYTLHYGNTKATYKAWPTDIIKRII